MRAAVHCQNWLFAMSLYVGVDVGTQGTKALVYDSKSNRVVSRGARAYEIEKTKVPGRAEQHPSLWIKVQLQTCACVRFVTPALLISGYCRRALRQSRRPSRKWTAKM